MLQINQLKIELDESIKNAHKLIAKKLKVAPNKIKNITILKESLDARNKPFYSYNIAFDIENEDKYLKYNFITKYHPFNYEFYKNNQNKTCNVVGFGPSGMIASYILLKGNIKPIIFEQGNKIDQRVKDVEDFWHKGILNEQSNVQFGEGGAGSFSDGKLTTRVKDERVQVVLDILIEHGADPKIKYEHHPHIGTDKLRDIVKNLRNHLIEMGAIFHFNTKVDGLIIKNNEVLGVKANNETYLANDTILAIGHSSVDLIKILYQEHVEMETKEFAIGVRVEHPQTLINKNQYKEYYTNSKLPTSEYFLTYNTEEKRGVYSFCMCPGGYVVSSSSHHNTICTNGMSNSKRDNNYANSAILVQVKRNNFDHGDLFDGFKYQKAIEDKAYQLTNSYYAPASNIKDFINNENHPLIFESTYLPGTKVINMRDLFEPFIVDSLIEAFKNFDKKIPGFIEHGIMVAPETRSSSMVRILRNDDHESISHKHLYPVGEGAGYAGGIISSALDGLKTAEKVILK